MDIILMFKFVIKHDKTGTRTVRASVPWLFAYCTLKYFADHERVPYSKSLVKELIRQYESMSRQTANYTVAESYVRHVCENGGSYDA